MALVAPNLDDLRFQRDLVDEARRRIVGYCPEWTEYNLSDPGITLIELFAWMTEQIVYRLNRVPERNYIKFLELLGMQPYPASSARTDLTFWLSVSLPISAENDEPVIVPGGTEVASRLSTGGEEQVHFSTDRLLTVSPPKLAQLRREEDFNKNHLPRLGIETFYAFDRRAPKVGDTFYLGFDGRRDLSGHILRLQFECEPTRAVGVRREDPPWVWECAMGDGTWQEIAPSTRPGERDTTGGLNNPSGSLVLYLPLGLRVDQVHGRSGYWVRCRLEPRRPEQGMYTESPRVIDVSAYTIGATVPATHAIVVEDEHLGQSSGEPDQSFTLEYAPVLSLGKGETIEVEENRDGELVFVPWKQVSDFSRSDRYDRHFSLDAAHGVVQFGPAVRQQDGTVRQYGRIPEPGRSIRFSRYRRGGGVSGNLPADSLQVLTTSLAYISRVTNPRRAAGGRDGETLEEVRARAQREMRAQQRAVTFEDYEQLALAATRSVARVQCNVPTAKSSRLPPGTVEILVVPAVADSLRAGDLSKLHVDAALTKVIADHLDAYRLLTTVLSVQEPRYMGIRVRAEIVPEDYLRPDLVKVRVIEALNSFLSPLVLADNPEEQDELMGADWSGWPFGRDLYVAEILSMIQRVRGVKHVLDIGIEWRAVSPQKELPPDETGDAIRETPALRHVDGRVLRVPADTLLCSIGHDIVLAELED